MARESLSTVIARFVQRVSADQVEEASRLLEVKVAPSPEMQTALLDAFPTSEYRAAASTLYRAWLHEPTYSGSALALAIRSAATAAWDSSINGRTEIVWTGPFGRVPVRSTYAVLIELVDSATENLTLVSFAAYRARGVWEALERAIRRRVGVRIILDSGTSAAGEFANLQPRAEILRWPPSELPKTDPNHASLHAKLALADEHTAFVTSANLTEYALLRNMELGLLIRGGPVPRRLAEHFDCLVRDGVLVARTP